jgi:hypothetical protein
MVDSKSVRALGFVHERYPGEPAAPSRRGNISLGVSGHRDPRSWTALCLALGASISACGAAPEDLDGLAGAATQAPPRSLNTAHFATTPLQRAPTTTAVGPTICTGHAHLTSLTRNGIGALNLVPTYWGPNVASRDKATVEALLPVFTSSVIMNLLLTEYGASGVPAASLTITPQISTGSRVSRADIETELRWQLDAGILPFHSIFLLHFPPTVHPTITDANGVEQNMCTPAGGACGYHGTVDGGKDFLYTVIPDHSVDCAGFTCDESSHNGSTYDRQNIDESHEISEALTDPDAVTGFRVRTPGSACLGQEIGDLCHATSVLLNNKAGSAWVQKEWSNRGNTCTFVPFAAGDIDGNGRTDLTLTGSAAWSNFIPVAFSIGDGTYSGESDPLFAGPSITSGNTSFSPAASQPGAKSVTGDFNGDGFADVALTGGVGWRTVPVAFSNGDGTFRGTNTLTSSTLFATVAAQAGAKPVAGDFDGDGLSDIALTGGVGWNTIPIAFSNGDGTFRPTNKGVTSGNTQFPLFATQNRRHTGFGRLQLRWSGRHRARRRKRQRRSLDHRACCVLQRRRYVSRLESDRARHRRWWALGDDICDAGRRQARRW